ncbi:hypothetical protein [Mycolicibacterium moriokaense]|uniref:hypothetical protein n=1 Tax=Mycolicibacterium moriokaense TaxID=39691 RepID=UPI0011B61413|nr:hypothetical protein [Mycolicibacterium moriokaense]
MPAVGDLVRSTTGAWIVLAPEHCPNGRGLCPGETLVGHQACLGHDGGHTTWDLPHLRADGVRAAAQHALHDARRAGEGP